MTRFVVTLLHGRSAYDLEIPSIDGDEEKAVRKAKFALFHALKGPGMEEFEVLHIQEGTFETV